GTYDASPTPRTTLPLCRKMSIEQGLHQRSNPKQTPCKVISRGTLKVADALPKKQAVPLPTATPHLQQPLGCSRTQMKSRLNPAMTPGEFHTNASPQPTSPPPPNNCEQPSSPIQVQFQEPPPLLRDNSAAPQKTPLWSSPSNLQHNPTNKLRPNPNPTSTPDPWYLCLELRTDKMCLRPLPPPAPPPKPTQPTNPHRVTLVLTPGLPTSSSMKEPPIPRRNNPRNKPRSTSTEASHSPTNPRAAPAQEKHPPIQSQQTSKL
ncbi:hypothetical protein C0989_007425, partial [Termitomyces sp. Mn162]